MEQSTINDAIIEQNEVKWTPNYEELSDFLSLSALVDKKI